MDKYYLTENIFINNDNYYYNDKLMNNNNWHNLLFEIGWEKLPIQFIKTLNKLSNKRNKNSQFAVMDCGDDGNCLYSCIATAFNFKNLNLDLNASSIRNKLADNISNELFNDIISIYRILKLSDDFDEEWDPCNISSLDHFKELIRNGQDNYWGDHICIQLIEKIFDINIIILNNNNIYNTGSIYNINKKSIILLYINDNHFQLIGYFNNNNMNTLFKDLPVEIIKLLK